MSGGCDKCTTLNHFTDALEAVEGVAEVSFYIWKTQDKKVWKIMDTLSGEVFRLEIGEWHNWITYENTCIQHLLAVFKTETFEKDPWKKNVILSVDFSRNYDNKQLHEIQSAYFGHKCFTIFAAACYVHKDVVCKGKPKFDLILDCTYNEHTLYFL